MKRTFDVVQPIIITEDGDFICLAREEVLKEMEKSLSRLSMDMPDLQAAVTGYSDEDMTDPVKKAEKQLAEARLYDAIQMKQLTEANLARSRRVNNELKDKIIVITFRMHRFSWNEKKAAQEAVTFTGADGVPLVDQAGLAMELTAACLDEVVCGTKLTDEVLELLPEGLSDILRDNKITKGRVTSFPPRLANILSNILFYRSEPDEARLAFLA